MDADASAESAETDQKLNPRAIADALDRLATMLLRLNVADLPYLLLDRAEALEHLPRRTSAVYLLARKNGSILYIGKALNLRNRWAVRMRFDREKDMDVPWREMCHSKLFDALELGDIRLYWWKLPDIYLAAVESLLLQIHRPPWNTARG